MKASKCKCCECGKRAVAFWPVIDPDIPSYPYCRKCLNKAKRELMIEFIKADNQVDITLKNKPPPYNTILPSQTDKHVEEL